MSGFDDCDIPETEDIRNTGTWRHGDSATEWRSFFWLPCFFSFRFIEGDQLKLAEQ